jgi:hypothetical protein
MPRFPFTALVAALCFAFVGKAHAELLITEFMAKNQSAFVDEDGDSSDWIEIYNAGAEGVDLDDYHLTDDPLNPLKWDFPTHWLDAGSYLMVFASGKDRRVGQFHTNFSLHSSGEYVALTNPVGGVVFSYGNPFPPQSANVSYGLLQPFNGGATTYFLSPTPGAANDLGATLADPPILTPTSQTFQTTQTVALNTPPAGAQWRYTLDGSLPLATSAIYTGPLVLTQSARLRAQAFIGAQIKSVLGGGTYLQVAADAATVTSDLPLLVIDNFTSGRPTNGTLAEWMIFEPQITNQRSSLMTVPALASRTFIKVRGSSTANDAKYSLAVEARNQLDQDVKVQPLGMPSNADWVLSASYTYDRTLIHNRLAFALDGELHGYAVRTRQVEVYINTDGGAISQADYYGVYTLMEKIERDPERIDVQELKSSENSLPEISGGYVIKLDRADPGDVGVTINSGQTYYLVDPKEQVITTAQRTWLRGYLNGWWSALNSSQFSHPTQGYAAYIDVPSALDHHLLNVAMKNLDALRLSTYLFKDRVGKLHYGPLWDFDRSMDSLDGRDNNFNTWRGETGDLGTDYFRYYEWNQYFRDPNFWQMWIDRYAELRRTTLSDTHVLALIDGFADEVTEAQARNFARWTATPPRTSWAWEIQHLKDWLTSRFNWMDQQFTRPATSNAPTLSGGIVAPGYALGLTSPSLARPGVKIYYTLDGTDPRQTVAPQDPALGLVVAGSSARGLLPTVDIGTAWHGSSASPDPYDDSAWIQGTNGIGYDDTVDYNPYIGINFEAPNPVMKNVQGSAYQRIKFTLSAAQLAAIQHLELRAHFDDGFVAFLNGTQIAAENAPTLLLWNSEASTGHADSDALQWSAYDVTTAMALLHVGENTLACHGLNTPKSSTDFLCQVELLAGSIPSEVSSGALEYTGPITISQNTNVIVRVFDPAAVVQPYPYQTAGAGQSPTGSHWSAPLRLSLFTTAVPATNQNVALTEIMYHPAQITPGELASGYRHQEDFQYVILRNIGAVDVSLGGIQFIKGIHFTASSTPQALVAPGASVALVRNEAAFRFRYGASMPILGVFNKSLNMDGDWLWALNVNGFDLADVTYDDSFPWPVAADSAGYSLVLADPSAYPPLNNATSWRLSLDPGGEGNQLGALSFSQWQARYFTNSADSGVNADPDLDGHNNLVEYALGMRPTEANESPLRFVSVGGVPQMEFKQRKALTNVIVTPQIGDTLGNWTSATPLPPVVNPSGTETIRVALPPGNAASRAFFRVLVTKP